MVPIYGGDQFSLATGERIVDFAIKHGFWIIPVCHGLRVQEIAKSYKPVTKVFLSGYLAYLKKQKDKVWVDTFSNVHRYLQARSRAQLIIRSQEKNHIALLIEGGLDEERTQELTVVIPVSDQVLSVTAKLAEDNIPLEVRLVGEVIVLNVPMNGKMVEVDWK
ncbi:MAG: hypothetical protein HC817_11825 [Saprospiraceae bacterium]|nr:hypothetical protein [Saprospiraceae bacterium]